MHYHLGGQGRDAHEKHEPNAGKVEHEKDAGIELAVGRAQCENRESKDYNSHYDQNDRNKKREPDQHVRLEEAVYLDGIEVPGQPNLPRLMNQAMKESDAELNGQMEDKQADGKCGNENLKLTRTPSVMAATADSLRNVSHAKGWKR